MWGVMEECGPGEELGPGLPPGLHQGGATARDLQALGAQRSGQEKGGAKALVSSLHDQHLQF